MYFQYTHSHTKFATSRSVLESFAQGGELAGGAALLLLQWASEMVQLSAQAESANMQGSSLTSTLARDSSSSREIKNLVQWYAELEALRRQCDDFEGGSSMASDAELR